MEKEKISIIVPVYNAEKYLDDCIRSIVGQTYANLEIILVNDNSKDRSREIMSEWQAKDLRIVTLDNLSDKHGAAVARNLGLDYASGDFIAFCDDDDTMKPQMLEQLHELIFKYNADVAFCSYEAMEHKNAWKDVGVKVFDKQKVAISELANPYDFYMVWLKLYRREIFDGLRMPTDIRFGDDSFAMISVYEKARTVVYTSERLYNYYMRADNDSNTMGRNPHIYWGLFRVYLRLFEYSAKYHFDMRYPVNQFRGACMDVMAYGDNSQKKESYEIFKSLYHKYKNILSKDKLAYMLFRFPSLTLFIRSLKLRLER